MDNTKVKMSKKLCLVKSMTLLDMQGNHICTFVIHKSYQIQMAKKLTPRSEDYSKWYNEIVVDADLAQHSDVKGCMVIKPYGYAIWERMKDVLDGMFKETGHSNAYFLYSSPSLTCLRRLTMLRDLPRSVQ